MTSFSTLHDSALIEKTLAGQSECFDVLMDRHTPAVRRRVRSMAHNTSDEDDLVQETFLKAWRHLGAFRSEASFCTWIARVATNEVLQQYRRDRSSVVDPATIPLEEFASHSDSPHDALARAEAQRTVRQAVAALPDKYRQVLTLCDLNELSATEVARCLQAGIPMVKTRLFRARRMVSTAILSR